MECYPDEKNPPAPDQYDANITAMTKRVVDKLMTEP